MIVKCNGNIVAKNVKKADTFGSRLVGLIGKKSLTADEGLLLINCPSIHCFFMRMTVIVYYLDKDMKVLEIETLAPWKMGKIVKDANHVLEFSKDSFKGNIKIGDIISLSE